MVSKLKHLNTTLRLVLSLVFFFAVAIAHAENPFENRAWFTDNEKDAGNARWDLIQNETKEIYAAYFIWDNSKVGAAALAGLMEAGRRGVKVKVVVDGWGPAIWNAAHIDAATIKALKNNGVELRIFNPVAVKEKPYQYLFPSTYFRMHDKLLYLESQKIAATGDRNMQNINFTLERRNGKQGKGYRSVETFVQGDVSQQIKEYVKDNFELSIAPDISKVTDEELAKATEKLERYLGVMNHSGHVPEEWSSKMTPVTSLKFVHDTPGKKGKAPGAEKDMVDLIDSAVDHISMTAPFFNIDPVFESALLRARKRNVSVTLLLPSSGGDKASVSQEVFSPQGDRLQKAGVELLNYSGDRWLHAKVIEVDGKKAYVGTHNFNPRSVHIDSESGIIVEDAKYATDVKQFVEQLKTQESTRYVAPPVQKSLAAKCRRFFIRIASKIPFVAHQL